MHIKSLPMSISKSLFFFFIFLALCSFGCSQAVGGEISDSLPCVRKLMPCQPYLKGSPPQPPCCVPLKQMVGGDSQCLCAVFKNEAIWKGLNVTLDDALNLVKTCGANADISICNQDAAPSGSPSANNSETNAPLPFEGAATSLSHVGGILLPSAALVSGLLF